MGSLGATARTDRRWKILAETECWGKSRILVVFMEQQATVSTLAGEEICGVDMQGRWGAAPSGSPSDLHAIAHNSRLVVAHAEIRF